LFISLGKKYLETDVLGKIYQSIFGEKKDFNQYFLGSDKAEKHKILNYAIYFLVAIIVFNIIALLINKYL